MLLSGPNRHLFCPNIILSIVQNGLLIADGACRFKFAQYADVLLAYNGLGLRVLGRKNAAPTKRSSVRNPIQAAA